MLIQQRHIIEQKRFKFKTDVVAHIINYFSEFIETDFKKGKAPKLQILNKSYDGTKLNINLNDYENLYNDFLKELESHFSKEESSDTISFKIGLNKYETANKSLSSAIKDIENFDFSHSIDSFFVNLKNMFDNKKTLDEYEDVKSLCNNFLKDFFDLIPKSYKNPSEFSKYLYNHCFDEYSDNETISKSAINEFVNEVKEYLEQFSLKAYTYLNNIDSVKDMVHKDGNYQYLLY